MNTSIRIILIFAAIFIVQNLMAQSEVSVSGLKPEEFKPVVLKVLKDNNYNASNLAVDVETDWKEYTVNLVMKYRAKIRFSYQDGTVKISLMAKQALLDNGSWGEAAIPSKKADDKMVNSLADAIKKVIDNPDALSKIMVSAVPANQGGGSPGSISAKPGLGQVVNKIVPKTPSLANAKELRFDDGENYTFSEGLCALKKNQLWGFIDTTGSVVVNYTFFANNGLHNPKFSSGIALVAVKDPSGFGQTPVYIDKKGQQLFKTQKFLGATTFENGIALVEKSIPKSAGGVSYHIINKQGLDVPGSINPGLGYGLSFKLDPFHEGMTKLYDGKAGSWGFINTQGKWVIAPTVYGEVDDFSEGLVAVKNNTNYYWGFINTKGEVKISFDYPNKPGKFSEGLAAVENSQEKVGYIDPTGKTVLPFNYVKECYPFKNGFAVVYLNDKAPGYIIIDKTGTVIRKLGTEPVQVFDNGWIYYKEWQNQQYAIGILSPEGKDILIPFYFSYVGEFVNGLASAIAKIDNKQVRGFINLNFDFVIVQTY